MTSLMKQSVLVSLVLLLCLSAAEAAIDLSIPSPTVSARADIYPDYPIVYTNPPADVMPPIQTGGMLSISIRASNFPQSAPSHYDFYLILTSPVSGKTYYAGFDIMKLLIGGFSLAEAISLSETSTPFISDLPLESDIDISIPIRLQGTDLSQGGYHVIAAFTEAGTDRLVGNRAVDKIKVFEWPVCCPPMTEK